MFHNKPYEKWRDEELPKCLKACDEHGMLFIGSCSGIGADADTWIPFLKEMEAAGVKMVELDTGGPHATFGAVDAQKDVGAPLAMDSDTAYKVTKACVEAVNIPIMFKMTPQCVNMASVAMAVERAGAAAISANNAFLWLLDRSRDRDLLRGAFFHGWSYWPALAALFAGQSDGNNGNGQYSRFGWRWFLYLR